MTAADLRPILDDPELLQDQGGLVPSDERSGDENRLAGDCDEELADVRVADWTAPPPATLAPRASKHG